MQWSTTKRLLYIGAILFTLTPVMAFLVYVNTSKPPTCYDLKPNGSEAGIDCGGECSLVCKSDVSPVTALGANIIKSGNNMYDIVAVVHNGNLNSAPLDQSYTIKVMNNSGEIIFENTSAFSFPPGEKTPIVLLNQKIIQSPATVVITLNNMEIVEYRKTLPYTGVPAVRVISSYFDSGNTPSVFATLKNQTYTGIASSLYTALLYDESDNIIGVSKATVFDLKAEEERLVTFVWPSGFVATPSRVIVLPISKAQFK